MKKIIFTALMTLTFFVVSAQKHNIVNASIALKNSNLIEAKDYIDQAFNNEKTSNEPKMWNYRAKIYLEISRLQLKDSTVSIDKDAIFKASEAHTKCLQTNKRGKIVVRKWTSEEDVRNGLMQCALLLFNMGGAAYDAKDYNLALTYYNETLNILPYDNDGILTIKKENVLYNSVFAARALKDAKMAEKFLQKLIDVDFNEPNIYVFMSESMIDQGNTDSALEFLSIGRAKYPSNEFLQVAAEPGIVVRSVLVVHLILGPLVPLREAPRGVHPAVGSTAQLLVLARRGEQHEPSEVVERLPHVVEGARDEDV